MKHLRVEDLTTVASGLDHPESVAVDADGVIWCGGEAGQIYRVDRATGAFEEVANVDGFCLGVACDGDGGVYVCRASDCPAVMRFDSITGSLETYCASAGEVALSLPNWAAFDRTGVLWCTDSGEESLGTFDGRIIAIPPGGGDATVVTDEPLHFPNGLCIGIDDHVYFVDTLTPSLCAVDGRRVVTLVDLPGHSPDGLVACADGGFIVACYYPFRLLHVPPSKSTFDVLLDDVTGIHLPMPTNAAFAESGGTELVIGSLGGQLLQSIDVGIPGATVHRPRFSA